jgi:hypothetical protein
MEFIHGKNYSKDQKEMFIFLNKEINKTYLEMVLLLDNTRG